MSMDDVVTKVSGMIEKNRFAVIMVGGSEDTPSFAYTVGLTNLNHPELVMVGLPPALAHQLLNDAGAMLLDGVAEYKDGDRIDHLIRDLPVVVQDLQYPDELFGMCCRILGKGNFRMHQVFMPDPNGKFPWDEDCDQGSANIQTKLKKANPSELKPH